MLLYVVKLNNWRPSIQCHIPLTYGECSLDGAVLRLPNYLLDLFMRWGSEGRLRP